VTDFDETEVGLGWLLVTVSTAGGPASLRMQVWRKLRSLGALYLQSSVCLLPARPRVVREVRRLVDRVERDGGTARVLQIALIDPDERGRVIAELSSARDGEYAEVLERVPSFLEELASERTRGRATYAEVEESEADLDRFRGWLAKIEKRDYFAAAGGAAARAAVERCAAELAAFEDEALSAEAPHEAPTHHHAQASTPGAGSAPAGRSAASRPRLTIAE